MFLSAIISVPSVCALTNKEICSQFSAPIVRIDIPGGFAASGFIVSPDGWILTAGHVMFDPISHAQLTTVAVTLPDGSKQLAVPISPTKESVTRDFLVLKVEKSGLPYLQLGTESEISAGSDIAIIGYPFSAGVNTKFCLFGSVTATDSISTNDGINVDIIYFQGPAVKGISGAPIISRDTGHVVGIQSLKLTGIGNALDNIRNFANAAPNHGHLVIDGVSPSYSVTQIINVLDQQLANGLGTATGVDDAASALRKSEREHKHKSH